MITDKTKILTVEGWRKPSEIDDTLFIDPTSGYPIGGGVKSFGAGEVWEYSLVPRQNTNNTAIIKVLLGRPQCVPLDGGIWTFDLRRGDKVLANRYGAGYDPCSWVHGFMYACNVTHLSSFTPGLFSKYKDALNLEITSGKVVGPPVVPFDKSDKEKASFIKGYLSAKGWPDFFGSVNIDFFNFFVENADTASLVLTGAPRTVDKDGLVGSDKLRMVKYDRGIDTSYFRVLKVREITERYLTYTVSVSNGGHFAIKSGVVLLGD